MSLLRRLLARYTTWFYPRRDKLNIRVVNQTGWPILVQYHAPSDTWFMLRGPIDPQPLKIFPAEESE